MDTKRKEELFNKVKERKWIARVINIENGVSVTTNFNSENDTFENILHKIELDLYTSLDLGLKNPIAVQITEMKKGVLTTN